MTEDDTLARTLLIVIAVVVLLPLVMMVALVPMMGMWGGHMMDGTGIGWLWPLTWVLLVLLIAGLGYLLYRALGRPTAGETDPAMEELRAAYARGELSSEEFEERRSRLREEQR